MAQRLKFVKPERSSKANIVALAGTSHSPVKVVKKTSGPVTLLQKFAGYYKEAIVVIGSLLIILNQVGPFVDFFPVGNAKNYFTAAVAFVTAVLAFLKDNEHWVDDVSSL